MPAHSARPRHLRRTLGSVAILIVIVGTSTLYAQRPVAVTPPEAVSAAFDPNLNAVRLLVGRSAIVALDRPIARVSLTSPDVADALVTSPSELLVNGKMPGTISMFVWDRAGSIRRYEIVVQRDLDRLAEQIKQIFPGEHIEVAATGKKIALSGKVSSQDIADKIVSLATGFVESKDDVVSLLQLGQGAPSNQVLLHVRFAEVTRNAMTELGASLISDGYKNILGRSTTEQFPAPNFDSKNANVGSHLVFSDFLNLFLFDTKNQVGAVIQALQTRGLFQSLAEPNLVAESGKEASFLAGGEFPVPVAQGTASGTTITVQYKEFGIRLNFTPVVNGNRVDLKVRPEVSSLDFGNAVTLNGFKIPALTTRRTETQLELLDGQTFAIAGLLDNTMTSTLSKIPGIGDIPVLGLLFQSKSAQKDRTELVVIITPEILPQNSPGVTTTLPKLVEPYLPPLPSKKAIEPPPAAFPPGGRSAVESPAPTLAGAGKPTNPTAPNPADAAAALKALSADKRGPTQHLDHTGAPVNAADPANGSAAPSVAADTSARPQAPPMTDAQKKALAAAQKKEQEQAQADVRAQAAAAKRQAKVAAEEQEKEKVAAEHQAEEAREQAKRDAALQKKAAEQAKKQAELDKQHQKVVDEAKAKADAADAAYQAALAKKQVQP